MLYLVIVLWLILGAIYVGASRKDIPEVFAILVGALIWPILIAGGVIAGTIVMVKGIFVRRELRKAVKESMSDGKAVNVSQKDIL